MSKWWNELTRTYNPAYHMLRYSPAGLISQAVNGQNFVDDLYSDKHLAESEAVFSGLPIIGGLVKGLNGVQQIEDLYDSTGKIPAYPGAGNLSASALGKSLGGIARKVEEGANDLFEYYSGTHDSTEESLHRHGELMYGDEFVNKNR